MQCLCQVRSVLGGEELEEWQAVGEHAGHGLRRGAYSQLGERRQEGEALLDGEYCLGLAVYKGTRRLGLPDLIQIRVC